MEKSEIAIAFFLYSSPFCLESSTWIGQCWWDVIVIFNLDFCDLYSVHKECVDQPRQREAECIHSSTNIICHVCQATCKHWKSKGLLPNPSLKDSPSCRVAVCVAGGIQMRGVCQLESRENFQLNFLISIPHRIEHFLHELGLTLLIFQWPLAG